MNFEVVFSSQSAKFLKKSSADIRIRILKKISELKTIPESGKNLKGKFSSKRSLRIGDYRIVYEIKGSTILIVFIDHRKKVYGKLNYQL
ncbi:MAG: type II toxin-antitoxin system RelE/ParE family toxin [Nitrospirota bacterium]|nr:type II toxin-antitoxin system RelE/ParE family toxin [Nitrospirota bacterium]